MKEELREILRSVQAEVDDHKGSIEEQKSRRAHAVQQALIRLLEIMTEDAG